MKKDLHLKGCMTVSSGGKGKQAFVLTVCELCYSQHHHHVLFYQNKIKVLQRIHRPYQRYTYTESSLERNVDLNGLLCQNKCYFDK